MRSTKRTRTFHLSLPEEDYLLLQQLAPNYGMARLVRAMIWQFLQRARAQMKPDPTVTAILEEAARDSET